MTTTTAATDPEITQEARRMQAFATKRHAEHTTHDEWCRKCRVNEGARLLGVDEPYPVAR